MNVKVGNNHLHKYSRNSFFSKLSLQVWPIIIISYYFAHGYMGYLYLIVLIELVRFHNC